MSVLVVGAGGIFRDAYLPALAFSKVDHLLIFDAAPEQQGAAVRDARSTSIPRVTPVDTLACGLEEADAVIVTVPPSVLGSVMMDIFHTSSFGSRVLVEKPAGVSADEAATFMRSAAACGVDLCYMETFIQTLAVSTVLEEITSGRCGSILRIDMQFSGSTPKNLHSVWRGKRSLGGEVLHDWGVHSFGLLGALFEAGGAAEPPARALIVQDVQYSAQCLVDATVVWPGLSNCEVRIRTAWASSPSYDLRLECDDATFVIRVGRLDGRSVWTLYDITEDTERLVIAGLYPKEPFVRGIRRFLTGRQEVAGLDLLAFRRGVYALEIADRAYEVSPK